MKKSNKKLNLSRTTVRDLADRELAQPAGGSRTDGTISDVLDTLVPFTNNCPRSAWC